MKSGKRSFRRSPIAAAMLMLSPLPMSALAQYQGEGQGEEASPTESRPSADKSGAPPPPGSGDLSKDASLPEVKVTGSGIVPDDYNSGVSSAGAKIPTALRDIPQPVTVVNRALMDAQGAASLQDAVRYVPDITFAAAEGGTIGNNITLRGFSARTDIYLDGFRDRGQYYRDTFFLDSLEVLEGPSSMLFGRGSTGGVINQVSKQPSARAHDQLSATLGTSDYYRTTGDFDHPLSPVTNLRLATMAQSVHSTRDVMHNEDFGAAPSLAVKLAPKTDFTLIGLLEHNHDMPDYGLPPVNGRPAAVSRDTFYGLTDDHTTQDVAILGGRLSSELMPGLKVRNQIQYSRYIVGARETAAANVGTVSGGAYTALTTSTVGNLTTLPQGQLFVQLGSHDRRIRDTSADDQTDFIANFRTGAVAHTLLVGAEMGHDTYTNQGLARSNLPVFSLVDPIYEATPANVTSTVGNLSEAAANGEAGYLNDTASIGQHWKVVGGLRWDRFKAQLSNSLPTATTPPSARQTVYYDSVRGGIIYQPTSAQSYYISYGTSFDPSLEYLSVTAGQQALPPVKNRSYEVGAKWDLMGGALSVTSALFQIRQMNARSQVDTGVYELVGTERVNGAEVTASGKITPQWQIFGGYTYLDPKIVSASALDGTQGKTLLNTPRNDGTLWTAYAVTPRWNAGTGLVWLSSRYANNTNTVAVPGYVRWDAMLAYHLPRYELRLNLLNITNRRYFDSLIQSDAGRSIPGASRTALVTLTANL